MFRIATNFALARAQTQERVLMVHGHTETFNSSEKASHNMLGTEVNSHCNVTIIGDFYQLDVELMLIPC